MTKMPRENINPGPDPISEAGDEKDASNSLEIEKIVEPQRERVGH